MKKSPARDPAVGGGVVEISAVRVEAGQDPQFVLDTPVNPQRPMAATEIHGISDEDVADAPVFEDVAGGLFLVLSSEVTSQWPTSGECPVYGWLF